MTNIQHCDARESMQASVEDELPLTLPEIASMLTDSALALHALAADAPVPAALKADMIFDMGVAVLHLWAAAEAQSIGAASATVTRN